MERREKRGREKEDEITWRFVAGGGYDVERWMDEGENFIGGQSAIWDYPVRSCVRVCVHCESVIQFGSAG